MELLKNPLNNRFIAYLESLLAEKGFLLAVIQMAETEIVSRRLSPGRVDGIIFLGIPIPEPFVAHLDEICVVHVFTPGSTRQPFSDIITSDYWVRGLLAADYLVQRGHQRIAYVNFQKSHVAFNVVGMSFVAAGTERGVQADVFAGDTDVDMQELMKKQGGQVQAAREVMRKLLALPEDRRPTGIHVANDQMAVELYAQLEHHGIRPMVDMDIIASDNEEIYLSKLSPRPATFELNLDVIASAVVDKLIAGMHNKPSLRGIRTMVAPEIVQADA